MTSSDPGGTLLVPIANTETADRLMNTAVDLARDRSYSILIWHVVAVPPQVPLSSGDVVMEDDDEEVLEYARDIGDDAGVDTEYRIQFSREVSGGILTAVEDEDVDLVLMGWRGRPPRRGVVLGSYIDRVLKEAPCDVLVKRIKTPQRDVESLLVPVGSGPHTHLAAEAAGSLARQHDARVELLRVVPEDASSVDREEAEDLLQEATEHLGDVPDLDTAVEENDHVAGEITDRSAHHDFTLLATSQKNVVRRRLLGSVSDDVGRHAAGTVVLAQREV